MSLAIDSVLTAYGPGDLLNAIPYLLGFHPRDSVVVVFLEGTTISAVARLDVVDAAEPGRSVLLLGPMLRQVGIDGQMVLVGYGDDAGRIRDVLAVVSAEIAVTAVACLVVCSGSWWHVEAPESRGVYDPTKSRIAAEATFCGITAVSEREDLKALFDRSSRLLSAATLSGAAVRLDGLNPTAARQRLGELLDHQLEGGQVSLRARDCAEMLLLLDVAPARDAFWMRLNAATSHLLMDVWLEVARRAPAGLRLSPVCAAGVAAWQGCTGALVSIALEQADEIGGRHPLHDLLNQIHRLALPPSALGEILAYIA